LKLYSGFVTLRIQNGVFLQTVEANATGLDPEAVHQYPRHC
jgi:hypothetical protein